MTGGTIYSKAILVAFATCAGFGGAEAKECHRTEMRTNYVLVALPSAVKLVGRDACPAEAFGEGRGPIAPQSPTLTTEYAYQYDDIGNRITSFDLGTNRTYTANNLNQYLEISTSDAGLQTSGFEPQYDDDMRPRRRRRVARRSEATEPRSGRKRPRNETLIQTSTGIWQVQYNGENRPVLWERIASDSNTQNSNTQTLISMSFDRMGRRVQHLETTGATTNANNAFTYDNYLLVARHRDNLNGTFSNDRFIWDPTEPIATRPLVFYNFNAQPQYYTHDGNKNVSDLTGIPQNIIAHYEYAPFGSLISLFGVSAFVNPFRFSSSVVKTKRKNFLINIIFCLVKLV